MATETTTIDDRELQRSLRRLTTLKSGRTLYTMTKQSARRVAVNHARSTAPFGFGPNVLNPVKKKIRSDHFRTFSPPGIVAKELTKEQRSQFSWLTANSTPATIRRFIAGTGLGDQYRRVMRGAQAKIHKARRTRNGAVNRHEQANTIVLNRESLGRLINKAQRRAGLAKHAWSLVARSLGGTRGIPTHIKRSRGKPRAGTHSEVRTRHGAVFTLTNHLPYASRMHSATSQRRDLARETAYLRQQIAREVQRRW